MDDLIRRCDVIKAIGNFDSEYPMGLLDCEKLINNISPAQQWIPCSERFPEQGVEVLVTWINGVDIAHWDIGPDGRYWDFGEFWLKEWEGEIHDVIAWMPLPEPYTEEQT